MEDLCRQSSIKTINISLLLDIYQNQNGVNICSTNSIRWIFYKMNLWKGRSRNVQSTVTFWTRAEETFPVKKIIKFQSDSWTYYVKILHDIQLKQHFKLENVKKFSNFSTAFFPSDTDSFKKVYSSFDNFMKIDLFQFLKNCAFFNI